MRRSPNVLVTGVPCSGKTSTCEQVAENCGARHVNVGALVKDFSLHDGRDDRFDAFILDEDKLLDHMEEFMGSMDGGNLVDFHSADLFPERWFDYVVVLRVDNGVLYARLEGRGYDTVKIQENIEAEIMQVVVDEVRDAYREEIILELNSDSIEDMDDNVAKISELFV